MTRTEFRRQPLRTAAVVLASGLISGTILGVLLKAMQALTGAQVYRLLLNVDFIPYIQGEKWSESEEFTLHLIFSVFLAAVCSWAVFRFKARSLSGRLWVCLAFVIPAALLYFPLSILSAVPLTRPDDPAAFSLWAFAHFIYTCTLALIIKPAE